MSGVMCVTATVTTNGSGDGSAVTPNINGRILKICIDFSASAAAGTTTTVIANGQTTAETVLTLTSVNTDAVYYPRAVVCISDGTAGGANANLYDYFVINSPLTITNAAGGATKTNIYQIFWESLD